MYCTYISMCVRVVFGILGGMGLRVRKPQWSHQIACKVDII